ncbi:HAMP domain-containing histidine kinase [Vallitalea pronyensis]|uniref:histidine kinase n=1 Tax=Vallitalea pronyensis TaxID=1348613 RepID=A0A8J8MMI8_9FIRM|nr:HAMP domain-containing sensor histidine kinase [Vallitalea pronyensis]QUI24602.1 HAMP domain-containing histidine kinase [Vallitalea pronyensis]
MKGKSLNFKLMVTFIGVILFFSLISYTLLIQAFQNYYYEDIYKVLEADTDTNKEITDIDAFIENNDEDIRSIEQLYWVVDKGKLVRKPRNRHDNSITEDVLKKMEENLLAQDEASKRYSMTVNGRRLFYVITIHTTPRKMPNPSLMKIIPYLSILKGRPLLESTNMFDPQKDERLKAPNKPVRDRLNALSKVSANNTFYKVALRWAPLDNSLEQQLYIQLGIVLIITAIATLAVFFILSRYLTLPLNQLSKSVKRISNRKFDIPITINRQDEIGFLAQTIEEMRKDLLSYDEEQKLKLHSISHELKTPIMIIQSYVDAIKRGLYPKGTSEASLDVIDEECSRLEKLVKNLLYIQRLDYFDTEIKHTTPINLKDPIQDVLDNMVVKMGDIQTDVQLQDAFISADYNQIKIIVENIMSNQIRYADASIKISLTQDGEKAVLAFYNDGEPIDHMENIFKMFKKGKNGQSGLGLYIVKRLVRISEGEIYAMNEEHGVTFRIEWPLMA